MSEITEDQIEALRQQVTDGNNVKAVLNSKGWRETVTPKIKELRERFILVGRTGYDQGSNTFQPSDPNLPAKAMWTLNGIDAVLYELELLKQAGESAKQILNRHSDTPFSEQR